MQGKPWKFLVSKRIPVGESSGAERTTTTRTTTATKTTTTTPTQRKDRRRTVQSRRMHIYNNILYVCIYIYISYVHTYVPFYIFS